MNMEFRLATMQDLPQLKAMFQKIIQRMDEMQISIWDDIYPCEFFEADIKHGQLYILLDGAVIYSAFALCDENSGENHVKWADRHAKALYLDRLGVNVDYSGRGIGGLMLKRATQAAKALGAEYLRLFVVDVNGPARRLYARHGFTQVSGVYDEMIDETLVLHEYGYEMKL